MPTTNIASLPGELQQGADALMRLLDIAHGSSSQPRIVARFLMSLYNGDRFPFDLTDFRSLDSEIFDDCLAVLRLDCQFSRKVHRYIEDGEGVWERLAKRWRFNDHGNGSWR